MAAAKGLRPGDTFTEGKRTFVVQDVNPDGSYTATAVWFMGDTDGGASRTPPPTEGAVSGGQGTGRPTRTRTRKKQ